MSESEAKRIQALLDDPDFMAKVRRKLELDDAKAVKCFCGDRCDSPYGNGKKCIVCSSRPTAKDMVIIVY